MSEAKLCFSTQIVPHAQALEAITTFIQRNEANAENFDNASYTPKEEDFIRVPFRLLSAHIVGSETWKSTDFSDEAVLKASMPLLEGMPAYINHGTGNVLNAIGTIERIEWQEAYIDDDGKPVPAGIIGNYKIDAVVNFQIARGLLSNPPSIQGSSVGIKYEYVPSHVFPEEYMFRNYIGDIIDGREVTRVVTKIIEYYESSLVSVPADKYAKIITASTKPQTSRREMSLEAAQILAEEKMQYNNTENAKEAVYEVFEFEAQFAKAVETPTPEQTPVENDTQQMAVPTQDNTAALQGLQTEVATLKGQFETELDKANDLQAKLATLKSELDSLSEAKAQLEADKASLKLEAQSNKALADFGKTVFEERRNEVLRLYTLANEIPEESVLALINSVTPENLDGLMAMFGGKVVNDFGGKCEKCGSDKVTFRKSVPEATNPNPNKPTTNGNDIRSALQQ